MHALWIKRVCFFPLRINFVLYFSYTATLIPSKWRKPPYSHCCQHLSPSFWGQALFKAFSAFSPLFPRCYVQRGLCHSPFAHDANNSQFRQVASPSTFINSRFSTSRGTIFNKVPAENSKEYRLIASWPSYAGINLSGTGKILSKQILHFNQQIDAASFLQAAVNHPHGSLFRF